MADAALFPPVMVDLPGAQGAFALGGGGHHEAHDEAIETQRLSSKAGEIRLENARKLCFFLWKWWFWEIFSGKMMVKMTMFLIFNGFWLGKWWEMKGFS